MGNLSFFIFMLEMGKIGHRFTLSATNSKKAASFFVSSTSAFIKFI
jgi:hypothetical protein